MAIEKVQNIRAHTRYKTAEGKQVPGTTTITGILNKPALVKWANNLGLQGIDSNKYVDKMASIGTLAHYLIQCELSMQVPNLSAYSQEEVGLAENALISFYEWQAKKEIVVISTENQLVSEEYKFGGTIDCIAEIDGILTLLDFKTGKAIYPEMFLQLAAYLKLVQEAGYDIKQTKILRIGRDENEGFEERTKTVSELVLYWAMFYHCKEIYDLKKKLF